MIRIYTNDNFYKPYRGQYKYTLVLGRDVWDDFGYQTMYKVYYCDAEGEAYTIGAVKIYNISMDDANKSNIGKKDIRTYISTNSTIEQLTDDYCSLGQDIGYYSKLKELLPDEFDEVLKRLRDLVINEDSQEFYLGHQGVKDSLLREGSANKAFKEATEVLKGTLGSHDMSFEYIFAPPYSNCPEVFSFDFSPKNKYFPYRINAVVGKNGAGKTLLLSSLSGAISGLVKSNNNSRFVDFRPAFYKVMSITFSVFDPFIKSKDASFCSYVYCGIQKEMNHIDGYDTEGKYLPMSKKEVHSELKKALSSIKTQDRYNDWKRIIIELIGESDIKLLEQQLIDDSKELRLSSGQNMLVLSMSMVIANIEHESILLIDEPETHLHPNAIASYMRMLNMILEKYDSYAIIATHSPIVLQELPTYSIIVMNKGESGDYVTCYKPSIECFGTGISSIIDDIFDVRSYESSYKTILKNAINHMAEQEILEFFKNDLSMNAMIYLKSICEGKK